MAGRSRIAAGVAVAVVAFAAGWASRGSVGTGPAMSSTPGDPAVVHFGCGGSDEPAGNAGPGVGAPASTGASQGATPSARSTAPPPGPPPASPLAPGVAAPERPASGGSAAAAAGGAATGPGEGAPGDGDGPPPRYAPDQEGIRDAVRASLPELKTCYEEWLKLQPGLAGTLRVSFTIAAAEEGGEDAEVRDVRLQDSTLGHLLMEGCAQAVLADLAFAAPESPVDVTYPLAFAPE